MNKCFFAIIIALAALPIASGETLFERNLGEMGYESLAIEGAQKTACQEIKFVYPTEIDFLDKEISPIASIGLEIGPVQEGKMDANVFLNGQGISTQVERKDFKCTGKKCWERITLPKETLKKEENTLKICLTTGNSISRITLLKESGIGLYKTADFSEENSFTMQAEKTEIVIGEKTEIKILLHNQGGALTNAKIQFARPLAEDKNAFSIVEGDTYFEGEIGPGEEIEITYVVKPRIAVHMTLPPAIVYYENAFGEEESKFSNLVPLNVREPERKIEAFIVKEQENAFVGEPITLKIAVKNVGSDPLYNLDLEIDSEARISQKNKKIEAIQPKETKYLSFNASSLEAGKTPINCKVTYLDINVSESLCQSSFVEFKHHQIDPAIYAGLILVAIAIAAYVYITKF